MAKIQNSVLVLEGETVKLRLLAERQETGNSVHVDWVRFTAMLRCVPAPSVDLLFPKPLELSGNFTLDEYRAYEIDMVMRSVERRMPLKDVFAANEFFASAQAYELACAAAIALGPDFHVDQELKKGMDFYKHRFSIVLNGMECGWVGFLSSSDSPRQRSQADTIHCNIFGTACTFASAGWRLRLADLIDSMDATLTRADLALDFFDGYTGGIDSVRSDYREGLCNVGGRKLKFNMVGDWENGHDRSLYIGSREAGKVTNVYEKGDQLFGEKSGSDWLRFELRWGNKLRVLTSDILRRPDDFFACASDWHRSVLLKAGCSPASEKILCTPRLQTETVQAECTRNLRWLITTAASSIAVAVQCLDTETIFDLIGQAKLPGRLQKFTMAQIKQCFGGAVDRMAALPELVKVPGTVATYQFLSSERAGLAFA